MDQKSIRRLRLLGLGVILVFFIFAFPAVGMMAKMEGPYKSSLAATLVIGIGLLLLAELAPIVQSFKAGGFEITFGAGVTDKFNELEKRLTTLEFAAAHPDRTTRQLKAREIKPPPALARKRLRRDDPWKGRFGGEASRDGFSLGAEFKNAGKSSVQIILRVTGPADEALQNMECVEFYLHDSFDPDVVPAVFEDGSAELSLLAYGGFTVGAWIPCVGVELELDLAELSNAPKIVREN